MKLKLAGTIAAAATIGLLSNAVAAATLSMATWGGGVDRAWDEAFLKPFAKSANIDTSVSAVLSPATQIQVEKGKPSFNTAIVTMFQAIELDRAGLLETFDMADFPNLAKVPKNTLLKSADSKLIGIPVYYMYYGIAVNTKLAKASDFASWKNLTDPKWKGKLSITRPAYSVYYDLPIMAYANGGDERNIAPGLEIMKGLASNALTTYASMSQLNQLLQRGEVVAAPYYSARVWQLNREGTDYIDMVIPKEGGLMLPFVVVVPKGASNPKAVRKFLEYVTEPEGQSKMMDISGYVPLNPDAKLSPESEKLIKGSTAALLERLRVVNWNDVASKENVDKRLPLVEQIMAGTR